jgi:hypothetical protein
VRSSFCPTTYTRIFVSKNALPVIRLLAAKREAGRQGTTQFAQAGERLLLAPIAAHLEFTFAGDSNFDLIALFEIESFDDC